MIGNSALRANSFIDSSASHCHQPFVCLVKVFIRCLGFKKVFFKIHQMEGFLKTGKLGNVKKDPALAPTSDASKDGKKARCLVPWVEK